MLEFLLGVAASFSFVIYLLFELSNLRKSRKEVMRESVYWQTRAQVFEGYLRELDKDLHENALEQVHRALAVIEETEKKA